MKNQRKLYVLPALLCAFLLLPCFSVNVYAAGRPSRVEHLKSGVTTPNSINLSWNGQSAISGYQIFRSEAIDGTYRKIMNINPQNHAFCNLRLKQGTEYYYKVRAFSKTGSQAQYGKFSKTLAAHTRTAPQKAFTRMRVNLRKHAGTTHPVLVTLNSKTNVTILCTSRDKNGASWRKVQCKLNGKTYKGYIRSDLLSKSAPKVKKKSGTVTASVLNVRSTPNTSGKIIGRLYRGQKVTILQNKNSTGGNLWYYVSYVQNGRTVKGYVSSRYIKL